MKNNLLKVFFILISAFCLQIFSFEAWSQELKIQVVEKGTQLTVKDVSVFILPDKLKAETDAQGFASLNNIMTADSQIVISVSGYKRLEQKINLQSLIDKSESVKNIKIYLEKESYDSFETVVTDQKLKRDQSQKTLTRKEFLSLPGANGDAVKAVQNLPGVNRVAGFSSRVVIQGSAPKDTAYDFEGHEIPIVFHFGGLSSVVMPEAVEQVDYLSAGYQADYGRALGGIISLKARKPEVQDRPRKGLFYMDNLSAGGLFESKIDEKSSFLVSGRYSYIGFFLKNAFKDSDMLDLTVAPEFQDITAVYNRQINANEEFKLSLLGSRDRLAFVFQEPIDSDPSIRGSFSNSIEFFRIIPSWTKKVDDDKVYKLSLGVGQNRLNVDIGEQYFDLQSDVLTARGEFEKQWSSQWMTQTGFDNQYSTAKVNVRLPLTREDGGVNNPISSGETREAQVKAKDNKIGLYVRSEYKYDEKISLMPGLRFDRFQSTKENFLTPRLAAQYKKDPSLLYKFGSGIYVQPPEPQEYSEDFGNPDIKSPQSIHFSVGLEKDFRVTDQGQASTGSTLGINLFDRWFDRLIIQSSNQVVRNGNSVYEVYNNDGRGRSYGAELQWKFNETDYNGFISYTISKSTRWDPRKPEYNFEYDQTHNFNFVFVKPLKNEWKVSTRFRYVTGNPYTPVLGSVYDADNEVYFPVRGPIYSERLRDFYQLDLRIDKKIVYDESIWSFYLDIQNVLNTKNPENIQYSYDYSQKNQISGLPILPALGVKGEF